MKIFKISGIVLGVIIFLAAGYVALNHDIFSFEYSSGPGIITVAAWIICLASLITTCFLVLSVMSKDK
jgi:hypothetical protein